jgi:histone H3/H4
MGLIVKLLFFVGIICAIGWYLIQPNLQSSSHTQKNNSPQLTDPLKRAIERGLKETGALMGERAMEGVGREVDKWQEAASEATKAAANSVIVNDAEESWRYLIHKTQKQVWKEDRNDSTSHLPSQID